jgi:hypothetical protein
VQHVDDGAAGERRASGQHLEQDRADGKQIGARVDDVTGSLLRRHVARRADCHARAGQPGGRAERAFELGTGEAEVEQLDAVRRQEHVRRLEVAVDQAAVVQRRQRGEHAERDRQRVRDAERAALQAIGQRLALEQLHGDEQRARILADLVDLADVRMVDARRRPRLAPEALARGLVARRRRHRLQRNRALEPFVARRIDDAHPAFAELVRDDVMGDAH